MSESETALQMLYLGLGLPGGFHVVERTIGGEFARSFIGTSTRLDWFRRTCANDDCFLSAAPHPARDGWPATSAGALWVPVEAKRQAEALRFFQPRPSLVLAAGDTVRSWAIWLLERPLPERFVVELNRRVAHRLKAPKKLSGLDAMLPAPGTVLRHGREKSPLLVRVVECREEFHSARAVAGWLPPAPDPDAWREVA